MSCMCVLVGQQWASAVQVSFVFFQTKTIWGILHGALGDCSRGVGCTIQVTAPLPPLGATLRAGGALDPGIRLDPENPESDDDSDGAPELVDNSD